MAPSKPAPPRLLTVKGLIDRRWVGYGTVNGVEWITDRFVLARADLFRTPPKPRGFDGAEPADLSKAIDRLLRKWRAAEPVTLTDTGTILTGEGIVHRSSHKPGALRLLAGPDHAYATIAGEAAAEWLRRPWFRIERRGIPVTFVELRRGRPIIVGAIMPVRLGHGQAITVTAVDG